MTTTTLAHKDTNCFTPVVLNYLQQAENLKVFITDFPDVAAVKKQIELKQNSFKNRQLLHDVLLQQYAAVEINTNVANNINSILNTTTFTITTAHQPCLFTGPLYLIYKIAHTIALANKLQQQLPQYHFVPVYYMGTEDADIDEVGVANIFDKKFVWQPQEQGPVGRLPLHSLQEQVAALCKYFNTNNVEEKLIVQQIQAAYAPNNTLAQATHYLINLWFGKHGLLIINPDDAALKQVLVPILLDEIENNVSNTLVTQTNEQLKQYYKTQANSRAINLFYAVGHTRHRIEQVGDNFAVVDTNTVFTKETLQKEISNNPQHFSGNVILRGVYQENILPNIIFIGGGGELAYWLQTKQVVLHYNTPFPLLVLRQSFIILDTITQQNIVKVGWPITAYFNAIADLKKTYVNEFDAMANFTAMRQAHTTLFNLYKDTLSAIPKDMQKSIAAHEHKSAKVTKALEHKLARALQIKHQVSIAKIESIKKCIFPDGAFQERHNNILPLLKEHGVGFIDFIIEETKMWGEELVVVAL